MTVITSPQNPAIKAIRALSEKKNRTDSGLFLGRTSGDLKGTLELVEFFGEDGAISRVHSGANFSEGDIIQLY